MNAILYDRYISLFASSTSYIRGPSMNFGVSLTKSKVNANFGVYFYVKINKITIRYVLERHPHLGTATHFSLNLSTIIFPIST